MIEPAGLPAETRETLPRNTILCGHALDVLRTLPSESVQCCVTSPPYFGLRSYGTEPQIWGGDESCAHEWQSQRYYRAGGNSGSSALAFSAPGPANAARIKEARWRENVWCGACGAWRGELGHEPDPDFFVSHLVSIFAELRRVLRDDGVLWVNIGDSYWTRSVQRDDGMRSVIKNYSGQGALPAWREYAARGRARYSSGHDTLKDKDLVGIPFRFFLAMQSDGWYTRMDVIWHKVQCMPESVEDRPTRSHEYVFLFAKQGHYFSDMQAIAESATVGARGSTFTAGKTGINGMGRTSEKLRVDHATRNARSVWSLPTEPWSGSHYAVMPSALAERCILSSTSPQACEWCGAPWVRMTTRVPMQVRPGLPSGAYGSRTTDGLSGTMLTPPQRETVGWAPTCQCQRNTGRGRCVVLDPFGGAGTTAIAAQRNDRDYLMIELSPRFARMAERRIRAAGCAHAAGVARDEESAPDQLSLFGEVSSTREEQGSR